MASELVPVIVTSAFSCGLVLSLVGSIKLPLAQRLGIDEARVGLLVAAMSLALVPMMLLAGVVIDALGVEWGLILGSLLTALGISLLSVRETFGSALGVIVLIGSAASFLITGTTVLMPAALFPEKPGAAVNLGHVFVGLGSLVTPVLAETLVERLRLRRTLLLLGLLCLIPAVTAALTPAEAFPRYHQGDVSRALQHPVLWLAALVFLCYAPLESTIVTWTTTYLTDLGYGERRAAWLLSGFWLSFLASRGAAAFLELRLEANRHFNLLRLEPWLILICALAVAVALGNLAGAAKRSSAVWGLMIVGFFCGPIYPTLVATVFRYFKDEPGTAFGAMYAVGAFGSLLVAPLMGVYVRQTTVQRSWRIPMFIALALTAVALVLGVNRS